MVKRRQSIKHKLLISVSFLVSLIVLGLTAVAYYQYHTSETRKTVSEAEAIISPFYEILRQELPDNSDKIELYLSVALQAKESSQFPQLLTTHHSLQGICFFNLAGEALLCHGEVVDGRRLTELRHIAGQLQVAVPFDMKGIPLGSSLLAFSSRQFENEKQRILFAGSSFLVLFLMLGLVGAVWVGRSIAGPIEELAKHIESNKLEDIPSQERFDEIGDFSRTINALAITVKRREQELERMAYYDLLTGLPNRTLLTDRLLQTLKHCERLDEQFAFLLIDLDNFKHVNDTLGHAIGDRLLVTVAQRINNTLGLSDIFARVGGDEFAIVLAPQDRRSAADIVAQKIIEALDGGFMIESFEFFVSASIGIAFFPEDGSDVDTLMRNADTAMYQAKANGRSMFRYYVPEQTEHARERLTLNSLLRHAVERGELYLEYQPQFNIADQRIVGVEALIRWAHPQQGVISPARFIPLAEESGAIVEIGSWVLREACFAMARWRANGVILPRMAINISVRQIERDDFASLVCDILRDSGLPPECIELEITESVIMNATNAIARLQELSAIGVHISIDDFGTGYSSLAYLRKLPINKLKIDRSFMLDLNLKEDNDKIVLAVINLAHSLNMTALAEGVEEGYQMNFLREAGCDAVQGYLTGKPLNEQKLLVILKSLA